MFNNKKAQGLSTTTIILLILGIFILVVLIIAFTGGFKKFSPFVSKNNVDTLVTTCELACSTNSVYGYCSEPRGLVANGVDLKDVNCNYLSSKRVEYGIAKCSSFNCNVDFVEAPIAGSTLKDSCLGHEGTIIQALVNDKLESEQC